MVIGHRCIAGFLKIWPISRAFPTPGIPPQNFFSSYSALSVALYASTRVSARSRYVILILRQSPKPRLLRHLHLSPTIFRLPLSPQLIEDTPVLFHGRTKSATFQVPFSQLQTTYTTFFTMAEPEIGDKGEWKLP